MLSNIQERIERTLFESIRGILIQEGYLPDIGDTVRYPEPFDEVAQTNWQTDLKTIANTKGFAIELFGASSQKSKSTKKTPRIVIMSRRSMPGDLGAPIEGIIIQHPQDLQAYARYPLPVQSTHFQFDIHLISETIAQDRILNAVLAKSLGVKKYIPYYDDPTDRILLLQYNYFDVSDTTDAITEKVYSYEIPDIYETAEELISIAKMRQITVDNIILRSEAIVNENAEVIGDSTLEGEVIKTDL